MKQPKPYPKVYLYRRIVQAKLYIDRNFHERINLNDMAGEAAFSNFHFIRLFKLSYNKTPHQYLTSVRISKAKELLHNESTTVADICFQLGFDSVSSFTSLFKRQTGASPNAYRMMAIVKAETAKNHPLKLIPGCFAKKNGWAVKKSNFQEGSFESRT